jgi:hypothetical protein
MASDSDVLKALVDEARSRGVHPDHERVLGEWRDENTTDDERRANLSDDERAEEDRKQAETSKSEAPSPRSGGQRGR